MTLTKTWLDGHITLRDVLQTTTSKINPIKRRGPAACPAGQPAGRPAGSLLAGVVHYCIMHVCMAKQHTNEGRLVQSDKRISLDIART